MHTPAWPCEQAGGMPQQGRWRLEQGFCGKFCLHWRRTHQRCGGSTLKMEERRGLLATEACKQVVQDDKAALDQHHLQLQNLLYERENRALQVIPVGNTSRFVARQRRGALPCGSTSCAVCAARQTWTKSSWHRWRSSRPRRLATWWRLPRLWRIAQLPTVLKRSTLCISAACSSSWTRANSSSFSRNTAQAAACLRQPCAFPLSRLAKDLADRKVRRKAVETMTGQKRKFLDALPQQLKAFEKVCSPTLHPVAARFPWRLTCVLLWLLVLRGTPRRRNRSRSTSRYSCPRRWRGNAKRGSCLRRCTFYTAKSTPCPMLQVRLP